MGMVITQSSHPRQAAAISLSTLLRNNATGGVLLLLSGGSAVSVLEQVEIIYPESLTIGLVDERFTIDPKHQNELLLSEQRVVRNAMEQGAHFVPLMKHSLSMQENVLQYEDFLHEWRIHHPRGVVIALLGVGADAHIAGIMPYPEAEQEFHALFEDAHWVQGYDAGTKSEVPLRMTVTATFLKSTVDAAVVYVVGEHKKEAVMHALLPFGTVHQTPVRLLREMKRVFMYTDIAL